MGRRSRKRGVTSAPGERAGGGEGAGGRPGSAASRRDASWAERFVAAADERPKPPWHPFPLVELCVLAGIVLIVLGFLNAQERQGRVMLLLGLVLASLAGLDTAVRDHFGGFRSHSMLLAGVPAVLAASGIFFAGLPWPLVIAGALAVFGLAFWFFHGQFRTRSGGHSIKL